MLAATHIAFSSALYLGGATVFEYETSIISWAIAALFSLMPDIDLPTSRVGRPLFFISVPLEKQFGHRTITHSFIGVAILCGIASPLYATYPLYFWAIVGGYWSHLQIDMANIRGVDLFWPSAIRVVMPGKIRYRLEVGSKAEMIVLCFMIVLAVGLYPMSDLGLRGGLHQLLRNFDIARDEYLKVQGQNFYSLELNAIDNLTLEHIECNCPILGAWQGGLIVEYNGKSRAVGESEVNHNLFQTEAVLIKGEPLHVITQRVKMNGRSLRWLVDNLQANHEYYLLGELFVDSGMLPSMNDIELYHPVMFSGSTVRLHYAKAGDLGEYLNMVAIRGEVVVQFWLKPGDEVVELRFSGGGSVGSMPDILNDL